MIGVSTSVYSSLMGTGFSPASIFTSGSQGVWYEPSDLTTMFQDRAGTTPVTTPGQTVGLRLDKSKGLVLGSELITPVANQDFSSDTGYWVKGGGATISGGKANFSASSGYVLYRGGVSGIAVGGYYEFTFTVSDYVSGSIRPYLGATPAFGASVSANGTYTARLGPGAGAEVGFNSASAFTGSIDNVSIKAITGNHAVAPTDAARPTYGIEPKTGRRNLLTFTEDLSNAVWALDGSVSRSGNTLTFTSTSTDRRYALFFNSATTPVSGNTYVLTARFTVASGSEVIALGSRSGGAVFGWIAYNTSTQSSLGSYVLSTPFTSISFLSATQVSTDVWDLSVLITANANGISPIVNFGANGQTPSQLRFNGNGTSSVSVTRFQLEASSTATAYQRVGTAFDVTEAGVPTVHYVQYDGTDDSFSTSSIDFTATDKMSVFAGVRKLSDTGFGAIIELSAELAANNGSFLIRGPESGANYLVGSKGTLTILRTLTTYTAPITNIITMVSNISGPLLQTRINGSTVDTSTSGQGTGNFGNYPLFIGRRGNSSLPLNGRDYGIIVVGKTASATEITNTESYLAANTSGVTI